MNVTRSPWGTVQQQYPLAEGIVRVHTAGHGGLVLSDDRLKAMPSKFKLNVYGKGRYFEEDCEAALVILAFPSDFTAEQYQEALTTAKHFYPTLVQ